MRTFFFLLFVQSYCLELICQTTPFELIYGADTSSNEVGVASIQMPGGEIFMLGNILSDTTNAYDVLLVKMDAAGQPLWAKSFDNGDSEFANHFIFQSGKFIIVGESNQIGGFDKNGFVLQVDEAGNELDFSLFGSPLKGEQYQNVVATDAGYLITGFATGETNADNDVLVRHETGLLLNSWERTYGSEINEVGMGAGQLANGNFIISGDKQVEDEKYNPFVLVLDANGDVLHETVLKSEFNGGCKNLLVSESGDTYVVGEMATPSSVAFDVYLAKVSPAAEVLWTKWIASSDGPDAGFDICQVNSGSFFITGFGYNEASESTDIAAISIDEEGNEIDRSWFGGDGLDLAYDVKPAQGGGFILTGKTYRGADVQAIVIHDFLEIATVGNEEKWEIEKLEIAPNPLAKSGVVCLPEGWESGVWRLVSGGGKIVRQGVVSNCQIEIPAANLPGGTYFLNLEKQGRQAVGKLVVP